VVEQLPSSVRPLVNPQYHKERETDRQRTEPCKDRAETGVAHPQAKEGQALSGALEAGERKKDLPPAPQEPGTVTP
jgi:hypothetical protein